MSVRQVLVIVSVLGMGINFCSAQNRGPDGDSHPGYVPQSASERGGRLLVEMTAANTTQLPSYAPGAMDERVWALEFKVEDVRRSWIESGKQNEALRDSIEKAALRSGQDLENVPDKALEIGGLIVKSEYACYAYVIASANTTVSSSRLLFARKAEQHCNNATARLAKGTAITNSNPNVPAVAEWARRTWEQPRIDYLIAMSKCIQATTLGDRSLMMQSAAIVNGRIPSGYLNLYPPGKDIVLRTCVAQ